MSASQNPARVGALDIDPNLAGQQSAWLVQRCARAAVILFLIAGVVGAFGGGWIGNETLSDQSGALTVTHARLARAQALLELKVEIAPSASRGGEFDLWVDSEVLDGARIESIQPEPISQSVGSTTATYRFRVSDSGKPVSVMFYLTTRRVGFSRGRLGVTGGPSLTLSRFTFP